MTLGDKLNKLALNSHSTTKLDPVTEAMAKGKAPTLGDVKQSVKACICCRALVL
jgi:meiosis-specific protein